MPSVKVVRNRKKQLPTSIKGPRKVKIGFPRGSTNVDKAIWNEFGTKGGASGGGWGGPIPERPFMRNTVRNNKNKYLRAMKTEAPRILRGEVGTRQVLSKLGVLGQNDIQDEITSLRSPPNSPVTIALKGSDNPLIDTGEMRQSVTWKIDE